MTFRATIVYILLTEKQSYDVLKRSCTINPIQPGYLIQLIQPEGGPIAPPPLSSLFDVPGTWKLAGTIMRTPSNILYHQNPPFATLRSSILYEALCTTRQLYGLESDKLFCLDLAAFFCNLDFNKHFSFLLWSFGQ